MCPRLPRWCLVLALLALLSSSAHAQGMSPPGRESLVSDMLGEGAHLASDCKLAGALIERDRIKARFDRPATPVVLELRHPSASEGAIARTDRFAIHLASGKAPDDRIALLAARVQARESERSWTPWRTRAHALVLEASCRSALPGRRKVKATTSGAPRPARRGLSCSNTYDRRRSKSCSRARSTSPPDRSTR
jgi:hypothetical protein